MLNKINFLLTDIESRTALKPDSDLKKEAASAAVGLIRNSSSIGLGEGATICWLAEKLKQEISKGLQVKVYTSSITTRLFLEKLGVIVNDIRNINMLDQYFDGCDQIDMELNVLKSGSGIHTSEKLFASMAKEFFILADESKFVLGMGVEIPLVLELIPEATGFVQRKIKEHFSKTTITMRVMAKNYTVTKYGNYLMNVWFEEWPGLSLIQSVCKNITGVVEISLFYQMADQAIIAGNSGISHYKKVGD